MKVRTALVTRGQREVTAGPEPVRWPKGVPHGDLSGYGRHRRLGIEPCEPCWEGAREHWRVESRQRREEPDRRYKQVPRLDDSWMDEALCRDAPPELFYASSEKGLAYCRACPVTDECLERAFVLKAQGYPPQGIWGGRAFTQGPRPWAQR